MSKASRALFTTPLSNKHQRHEEFEESPSFEGSSFSESLSHSQPWRTQSVRKPEQNTLNATLAEELQGSQNKLFVVSRSFFFFFFLPAKSVCSFLLTSFVLVACYKLLKDERRINNDFHRRVHGSPSGEHLFCLSCGFVLHFFCFVVQC
jgi:hypothetical protein